MKSVQLKAFGDSSQLQLTEISKPVLKNENDMLIKIKFSGINLIDLKIRSGFMNKISPEQFPAQFPSILGWETSGVVEETGSNVKQFKKGDEVYGMLPFYKTGTYAQYVIMNESEVALKPQTATFEQAAGLPIVASAAYLAVEKAQIKPQQKILVLGAAGSVGSIVVQLAKKKGAYVIGVDSGEEGHWLKELAIDKLIDYRTTSFATVIKEREIDAVIDLIGGPVLETSYKLVKKEGWIISTVMQPSLETAKALDIQAAMIFTKPDSNILEKIASLFDAGDFKIRIGGIFPLTQAAKAHEMIDNKAIKGKVILQAQNL